MFPRGELTKRAERTPAKRTQINSAPNKAQPTKSHRKTRLINYVTYEILKYKGLICVCSQARKKPFSKKNYHEPRLKTQLAQNLAEEFMEATQRQLVQLIVGILLIGICFNHASGESPLGEEWEKFCRKKFPSGVLLKIRRVFRSATAADFLIHRIDSS